MTSLAGWLALVAVGVAACAGQPPGSAPAHGTRTINARSADRNSGGHSARRPALPLVPAALVPFSGGGQAGAGAWHAAGRPVRGIHAVYLTTLTPPGGLAAAGLAWMNPRLLTARLYSGSASPGGGPYRYTAPIKPADAATLVAAFNGGFKMKDARGGYYTEGRVIVPLRPGAASLVIYRDGSVDVGAWGTDVRMTPDVVSVRQNLTPLVAGGRPTELARSPHWREWGNTCGASSCGHAIRGVEHQWRSGFGIAADGALIYVNGPSLAPVQLAELLVRAGVVRGMELDINPDWPVFVAYDPGSATGLAGPANGTRLLASSVQGPSTFFTPSWARDFITMSARS